ncbi:penicillin-binding protein 1C [Prosthecobacter sp.]|uniref:penicillin-binding protein 1C n=1 Tax=Prosthecobacter sp. TaxID=1965333 RepID=UPI002ABA2F15|nr:penicillin-binding protein 1C [Prosthecobacter sp.]MDZ4404366.1 penicillin-binding protein 1C [Prosthecobacter sp.]
MKRLLRVLVCLILATCITWLLLPRCELYPESVTWSRVMLDRDGDVLHLTLAGDGRYRLKTPLKEIHEDVIGATLTHEDRWFRWHPGVNPVSLMRGMIGLVAGQRLGGGSTVTMQLARLRFGLRTRSLMGKCEQIFRALQLERHHSKDEILEAYLNLAPYGGNVEGVGAASILWCGKQAGELSLREAVTLSVLPQSPARRRPRADADNAHLAAAQVRLIRELQQEREVRSDPLDEAFTLRAPVQPPREAPHLARRLLKQEVRVQSTVDSNQQRIVERSLADYISRKREVGIENACALLVHAPSREVLAYAGSARFLSSDIHGQVDGITARRSPGSALKPFIYAMALDQGLIHPRSLVSDMKASFGSYNPENFDRGFAGPITAADALFRSRNIPAVTLAQQVTLDRLYSFLKHAGVAFPKPASHYGLALPLGGAEVSMEELASLYVMLANGGEGPQRLRLDKNAADSTEMRPLLTQEAAWLVREMLRQPDVELGADDPAVSWKTGTSHGFRDAWAAGIRGEYVLVVWIGNFSGKPNPAFVARECAAPLLFETFQRLNLPWKKAPMPAGLREIEVCAISGQLPTPLCQHHTRCGFIPGVSPIQPCQIHQEVFTDATSGLRARCDDGRPGLKRDIYECWPPDMLALFRQAGLPRREPPAFEADAKLMVMDSGNAPRITSPRESLVYSIRESQKSIPLSSEAAPGVKKVYWFAGPQFLGTASPAEPLMWPASPGKWTVQVLDDRGRSASCRVNVEAVE